MTGVWCSMERQGGGGGGGGGKWFGCDCCEGLRVVGLEKGCRMWKRRGICHMGDPV